MFSRKEITKITMKRILFAIIIVVLATALRIWPLHVLENKVVWITYYPAVMAVALYAGLYGGLISTSLTLVIILYFYRIISDNPFINNGADWLSVGVFVFTCTTISFIAENMRQSNKRATESQKKAQLANEAKSAFLANMSHELRTPLNAILGYSRLMQRDQTLSAESMHYLNIINKSGEHLLSLINDILEITKIESRKETVHNEPFDLIVMIEDIIHMFTLKIEAKKLGFEVVGFSELPHFIIGDVLKLRVVLINLISNAIKFTDTGVISLIFYVTQLEEENIRIHIEVQDTGCGIDEAEADKLFQFFSQTESGINSKSGTGLGLAISQEYVRQMGGLIEVESHVGIGTRFFFNLEVKSTNNCEIARSEDNHRVHLKNNETAPKILVVDDIEGNKDLLVTILRDAGFQVFGASNGKEAVDICQEQKPSLIWMDIRMPIMDGMEATKIIRTTMNENQPIIIALSAHVFDEEKESIMANGFDDYLIKPFKESEIFHQIEKFLHLELEYDKVMATENKELDEMHIHNAIDQLKATTKSSLYNAVILLDDELIQNEINMIEVENPDIAQQLRVLADRLDYTNLLKFLKGDKRNG